VPFCPVYGLVKTLDGGVFRHDFPTKDDSDIDYLRDPKLAETGVNLPSRVGVY
jgi:hypothetical protein